MMDLNYYSKARKIKRWIPFNYFISAIRVMGSARGCHFVRPLIHLSPAPHFIHQTDFHSPPQHFHSSISLLFVKVSCFLCKKLTILFSMYETYYFQLFPNISLKVCRMSPKSLWEQIEICIPIRLSSVDIVRFQE